MDSNIGYRALGNEYRRRLLCTLFVKDESDAVKIPGTICEKDEDPETVYLNLYHTHIPKLEEMGLVRYNSDEKLVEKGEKFSDLQPYLRPILRERSISRQAKSER